MEPEAPLYKFLGSGDSFMHKLLPQYVIYTEHLIVVTIVIQKLFNTVYPACQIYKKYF